MLTQLVYTSRPRFAVSAPEGRKVLDEIAATHRARNAQAGISSAMLVNDEWISHIVEGDGAALTPVLKEILADERHEAVKIVEMRMVAKRHFEGVSVAVSSKPIADIPLDRLCDMTADEFLALAKP